DAVARIAAGGLVAFPTETIWGLGADARSEVAVARLRAWKVRGEEHPLSVLVTGLDALVVLGAEVGPLARDLAGAFWPGPLTLVLPRAETVHDVVTGGQDTVAIRIPSHPMARQLLDAFGGGIAAPSANRYGRLSATRAEHVQDEFGDAVKVILDGGECQVGLESTIVSCLGGVVRLLRPGAIKLSQLRAVVGNVEIGPDKATPRVPGSAAAHYAPSTPLSIVPGGELDALAESLSEGGQRIAVLAQRLPLKTYQYVTWINAGKRAEAFGHDLYANLRTLDKAGCARILVQEVPGDERWDAIRDRLARAAAGAAADSDSYSSLGTGVLP
ncbi:MAG TPA: L-threonylcarbamoyladenylate synthase, partial [Steroidobacteraceae bacterium]|nr:L-threonylcarbamoyladenylate synthase [Steroidobacteraceae bacterium]